MAISEILNINIIFNIRAPCLNLKRRCNARKTNIVITGIRAG